MVRRRFWRGEEEEPNPFDEFAEKAGLEVDFRAVDDNPHMYIAEELRRLMRHYEVFFRREGNEFQSFLSTGRRIFPLTEETVLEIIARDVHNIEMAGWDLKRWARMIGAPVKSPHVEDLFNYMVGIAEGLQGLLGDELYGELLVITAQAKKEGESPFEKGWHLGP